MKPLELEQKVAEIIHKQVEHGVCFDVHSAESLIIDIDSFMGGIEDKVHPQLPLANVTKSKLDPPPKTQFVKSGDLSSYMKKYLDRHGAEQTGEKEITFEGKTFKLPLKEPLVTKKPMHISDQAQLKEHFLSLGWKPTMWNYGNDGKKTSPMVRDRVTKEVCPNLVKLSDKIPYVEDIIEWMTLRSRRNVVQSEKGTGWLHHPRIQMDGRLPADADTLGAVTGRLTHRVVANVPRVGSVLGEEMRSLFIPAQGLSMVGWDASGLEARMEAHFTYPFDNGAYAEELLQGDIHSENAKLFGVSREVAKSAKYALTYGCSADKLSVLIGKSGKKYYDLFWKKNESLGKLKDFYTKQWKLSGEKYIIGLDGRQLHIRSKHSIINTLFQSSGNICMKQAMIIWHKLVEQHGLNAHQVIHYHDEAQCETDTPELAGQLGVQSIVDAGKHYNLNVPLFAEYQIGKSWAETH